MNKKRFFYLFPMILMLAVVVAGWFATDYLDNKARQEIIRESHASVFTLSLYVSYTINVIENAVKTLAASPWIAPALLSKGEQDIEHANSTLDRYDTAFFSISYLMDADGITVASSNRKDPDSFVGKSYRFRPYFQEALSGHPSRYFAVGATSGRRGFFASYPVQDQSGKVMGVVTMKKEIDELETFFSKYPFCFLISRDGVIFLSSTPVLVAKNLWPLDKSVQVKLIASRQFGDKLSEAVLENEIIDGQDIALGENDYFVSRNVVDSDGWSIVLLTPTNRIRLYRWIGILATISVSFLIAVFSGIIYFIDRSREIIQQREKSKRLLLEAVGNGIFGVDTARRVTFINPSALHMLGFSEEEMLHQNVHNLIHHSREDGSSYPEEDCPMYASLTRAARIHVEDDVFWRKDGSCFPVDYSSTPITQDGKVTGMVVSFMDISDRKRAEKALMESEKKYRDLLELSPVGIFKTSSNGQALFANPEIARILGTDSAQDAVETFQNLSQDLYVDPNRRKELIAKMNDQGAVENFEFEAMSHDGKRLWLSMNARIHERLPDGTFIIHGFLSDITERVRAQEALRESEKKYRLIAENTAEQILLLDMNLRFTYVSPSSMRIRGFTAEEVMSQTLDQVLTPESMKAVLAVFKKEMLMEARGTADPDRTHILELEAYRKDGTIICEEVSYSILRDDAGSPAGILTVSRDVTDRRRIEEALRESEEKFRLTFSSSPDSVNINRLDDGMYVDINEGFTLITGFTREDVIGRTSVEINIWHDPADRKKVVRILKEKGSCENLETQFRRKDGSLITGLFSARVISLQGVPHLISITRDITERKMMDAKLQQTQKFEAIGTLAGGIAHDFNNLLMGIQGYTSLLSLDLGTSHPDREHLHAIEEYIRSATNLTKQLLGFTKGDKNEVKPIDMNELVLGSSSMFGRTRKEIQIHVKCHPSPLVVEADRGQIEQVLLNMYVNAWQAMPPAGGNLYLKTKIVTLDESFCKSYQTEPGRYALVSITDTGAGMDEATRMRIFDPFFTTKEMGRGTGLGLASAYGIIKNHGGMITVYSEIGQGTTFNIYLPVSEMEVPRENVPAAGLGELVMGSSTILLVDDEDMIIDVGQAILERLGYKVFVARGGQEAIDVITKIGDRIDMVILDLVMPGMDSGTAFDRIRQIQPGMPILLSSGYAISSQTQEIMRRGCNGFIQKPYNITEISTKVRNLLDERIN